MKILPSPYFFHHQDSLYRAARVELPGGYTGPGEASAQCGAERVTADCLFQDGRALIPAARTYDRPVRVRVEVRTPAGDWQGEAELPPTRPFTIYITQDKHLDYGWIHPVEQVVERINTLTDFALDHHLPRGGGGPMRWTFESAIAVEEYMAARPRERGEDLLRRLRSGEFEVAANWLVPSPALLSIAEWVMLLAYSRGLRRAGAPLRTMLMEEAPSLPWGLATLLAEADLPYLIKGAYNLRNPHLGERLPLPVFWWQGPDGSRVLTRWDLYADTHRWGGYAEAYELWRNPDLTARTAYIEQTIERYLGYEQYPWESILLVGTGFDEFPQTAAVSDFIRWYNAQGWAYPRLVDATWQDFWNDLAPRIDPAQLPVQRGDFGTAWEEWPAQIARLAALYRRARAVVFSAQTLSALAARFDPAGGPGREAALEQAARGLLQFTEHDFGGICAEYAEDVYETKAGYAHQALRQGSLALESGITALAARITPAAQGRTLVAANPNGWARDGIVEVVVQDPCGYEVLDLASGALMDCQLETRGPGWQQHYLSFAARDLPPFGYRAYQITPRGADVALGAAGECDSGYENEHYRLRLNPRGGLASLVEKKSGREWVGKGKFGLNEYLYHSRGRLFRSRLVKTTLRKGPLCDHWIVETANRGARLTSTYRLYHAQARLEVHHALYKPATSEPQASWFAFPFAFTAPACHYDGAAAILKPGPRRLGGDLLPGAALSSYAVQSFLAAEGPDGCATLASPDSYLFQFGSGVLRDPSADSDPAGRLALALVLHNITVNDHLLRQGGQEHFTFRYALDFSPEPFQAARSARFAAGFAQDLPRAWVPAGGGGLPPCGTLLDLEPSSALAVGLQPAPDGQGSLLRLWECEGRPAAVAVGLEPLGAARAWACDLLGADREELPVTDGRVVLNIPAYGVKTFRFA